MVKSSYRSLLSQTKQCVSLHCLCTLWKLQLKGLLLSFQPLNCAKSSYQTVLPSTFSQVTSFTGLSYSLLQGKASRRLLSYNSHKAFIPGTQLSLILLLPPKKQK